MSEREYELMAHPARRAGFGAPRDELDEYVSKGYEAVVEEFLHPTDPQSIPDDIIRRYHVEMHELRSGVPASRARMLSVMNGPCRTA